MSARSTADLIVTAARIRTFGGGDEDVVEALAVADGVVVAAGSLEAVAATARPDAARLTAEGVILPGFCDTHMHFEKIASELRMLQLAAAETVDDVLQLVAEAARYTPADEWLQSFGDDNAWHESRLREKRLPTRRELDAVAPAQRVFLYRGGDAAALNSAAARALAVALAGDPGWNSDLGRLHSPLARVLQEGLPAAGNPPENLEQASQELLGLGITTIVDPGLPAAFDETWELYRRACGDERVLQRLYLMDRLDHRRNFEVELGRVASSPLPRDCRDGGLRGWGLKLIVDGEFDNAWMGDGEPQPAPAAKRYTPAELEVALRFCADRGWPITFHVMGRGAVEAVLRAVARVGGAATFERNQVTLAHGFLMSEQNIAEAARLGVGVSVQPLLAYVFEQEMTAAWGELAERANPYRLMLDAGADVAGGSDVLPCEPLRGAAVAVTRRSRLGSRLGVDQALTPEEALSLFTRRAGPHLRHPLLGTLEAGAPADFVCWPRDPLELPADEWAELRPTVTVVGGRVVWRDPSEPSPQPARKEPSAHASA